MDKTNFTQINNTTPKNRLFFADNLRTLMVTLVIMQHLAITFGAPGDWYIQGKTDDIISITLFTLFNGINETYFMAMLFMLAGYFTVISYERKGGRIFLKDRLLRLGIPMLFYDIFITSAIRCLFTLSEGWYDGSVSNCLLWCLKNFSIGTGPLWFIQRLLVFSLMYILWRLIAKQKSPNPKIDDRLPTKIITFALALALGLATFILRIWLPARTSIELRGLEFPLIPFQWISFFIIGIVAYRRNWLARVPDSLARFWIIIVMINIFVFFPAVFFLGGAIEGEVSQFMVGFRWQVIAYAVWQQFVGMGMIIFLSNLFRKRVNYHGNLARAIGASSYTAYIIHAPVVILMGLAAKNMRIYPLLGFTIASVAIVPLCFLMGYLIRKLPLARKIL